VNPLLESKRKNGEGGAFIQRTLSMAGMAIAVKQCAFRKMRLRRRRPELVAAKISLTFPPRFSKLHLG